MSPPRNQRGDIGIKEAVSDHRGGEMLRSARLQRLSGFAETAECLTGHWKNII